MCDYLILGIPEPLVEKLAAALPRGYKLEQWPVAAYELIPSSHRAAVLVTGGCSCSIYGGPIDEEADRERFEAKLRRWRRKGWSAEKLQRAIHDSTAETSRHDRQSTATHDRIEVLLRQIAEQPAGLYLLVHQYSGQLADERFPVETLSRPAAELRVSAPTVPRDVLVYFHPPAAGSRGAEADA